MSYFARLARQSGLVAGQAPPRSTAVDRGAESAREEVAELEVTSEALAARATDGAPEGVSAPPTAVAPGTHTAATPAAQGGSEARTTPERAAEAARDEAGPARGRTAADDARSEISASHPERDGLRERTASERASDAGPRPANADLEHAMRRVLDWIAAAPEPGSEPARARVDEAATSALSAPAASTPALNREDAPTPLLDGAPDIVPARTIPLADALPSRQDTEFPTPPPQRERRAAAEPVEEVVNLSIGTIQVRVDLPAPEPDRSELRPEPAPAVSIDRPGRDRSGRASSSSGSRLGRHYLRP